MACNSRKLLREPMLQVLHGAPAPSRGGAVSGPPGDTALKTSLSLLLTALLLLHVPGSAQAYT